MVFFLLISGWPKVGKSTLLTWLIRQWIEAGLSVVLLSEEPRQIVKARAREIGVPLEALRVEYCRGRTLTEVLPDLRATKADILVVDSFRGWQALGDENDPGPVLANLSPLLDWARTNNTALVGSHFLRKSGGGEGIAHAGTTALVGLADIAVELYRDRVANRRHVLTVSRMSETPQDLLLELREGEYRVLGKASSVSLAEVKERILEALSLNPNPATDDEIRDLLEDPRPSLSQTKKAITDLHQAGNLAATGSGTKGNPMRWSVPV